MAYSYDSGTPFYNYQADDAWYNNPTRFSTGGASPALTGTAAQLTQSNYGTQGANAFRDAMMRSAQAQQKRAQDASYASGGAGNYGAMAGIANNIGNSVNSQAQRAYGEGAMTNLKGVEAGGQLFGEADKLNNAAKNASLDYVSRFRPMVAPGFEQYQQSKYQSENWLPGLLKGLVSGAVGGLTGGATGWLGNKLFNGLPDMTPPPSVGQPQSPQSPQPFMDNGAMYGDNNKPDLLHILEQMTQPRGGY